MAGRLLLSRTLEGKFQKNLARKKIGGAKSKLRQVLTN